MKYSFIIIKKSRCIDTKSCVSWNVLLSQHFRTEKNFRHHLSNPSILHVRKLIPRHLINWITKDVIFCYAKKWVKITMINTNLYLVKTAYLESRNRMQSVAWYLCASLHTYVPVWMSFLHYDTKGPYLFILPYLFRLLPFSNRRQ